MFQKIKGIFNEEDLIELREEIKKAEFTDGTRTAKGRASERKSNKQVLGFENTEFIDQLTNRISENSAVKGLTIPEKFGRCMVNRYRKGEEYGFHMDAHSMGGTRTDLSYTIFLNPPDSYEGGELVITAETGPVEVKLDAGDMIIYPSNRMHRVKMVKKGERLAIVGWIQSIIKNTEERNVVIELRKALTLAKDLERNETNDRMIQHINTAAHNITRILMS